MIPRSLALQSARGPSSPNGVTATQAAFGAIDRSIFNVPGQPGVMTTTSHSRRNRRREGSSRPEMERISLPADHATNRSESPSGPSGDAARKGSPSGSSGLTTQAPRSAKIRPVMAAGSAATSMTRRPSSNWLPSPAAVMCPEDTHSRSAPPAGVQAQIDSSSRHRDAFLPGLALCQPHVGAGCRLHATKQPLVGLFRGRKPVYEAE